MKAEKKEKRAANEAAGKVCDFDYDEMIQEQRSLIGKALNHVSSN